MRFQESICRALIFGLFLLFGQFSFAKVIDIIEERIPYDIENPEITATLEFDRVNPSTERAWLEVILREPSTSEAKKAEVKKIQRQIPGLGYDLVSKEIVFLASSGKVITCANVVESAVFLTKSKFIQMTDNCKLRVTKLEESEQDSGTIVDDTYTNHYDKVAVVEFSVIER